MIRAISTPGHRPEHLSFLVADRSRGDDPWLLITGDTLLVGDVARPDLAYEPAEGAAGAPRDVARAARPRRSRRDLAGARRRIAVWRRRPQHEDQLDDRLRTAPQPAAVDGRARLRRRRHRQPALPPAEHRPDRRAQPPRRRPRARRASDPRARLARRAVRGRRDRARQPLARRVRRRPPARIDQPPGRLGRLRHPGRLGARSRISRS